jgi:hypothetical protein
MEFNLETARQYAQQGRIEDWVKDYLNRDEPGKNKELWDAMDRRNGSWSEPVEVSLSALIRCWGEDAEKQSRIKESNITPENIPPLLVRPDVNNPGMFIIDDGGHRWEKLRKSYEKCWVLVEE